MGKVAFSVESCTRSKTRQEKWWVSDQSKKGVVLHYLTSHIAELQQAKWLLQSSACKNHTTTVLCCTWLLGRKCCTGSKDQDCWAPTLLYIVTSILGRYFLLWATMPSWIVNGFWARFTTTFQQIYISSYALSAMPMSQFHTWTAWPEPLVPRLGQSYPM